MWNQELITPMAHRLVDFTYLRQLIHKYPKHKFCLHLACLRISKYEVIHAQLCPAVRMSCLEVFHDPRT